ncbi:glycosyltransferase family 4 protein [Alkaliphilus peptidifermentans]|uniref:Glycosyltransferase involved in cell wall bisynthesis n=1 Tax=Alkaliphilus peptidifermentans DSM 18978 TaxID=1120976 RepID=A0A1G5AH21_9FIRM|nr:glycosyltransferase family 4 protein [Alkaliphilus peptidifermentans]SCX77176.1 Glycosyltransferase involved in cell wall bisynthesis [Alkaliphilus peptidifermentans DSM 18978]
MNMLKIKKNIARILNKKLYFKYKDTIRKKTKYGNNSKKIILISHESSDSGAVILLLEIIKELYMKKYNVKVLSRDYGPFIEKASEFAFVEVFANKRRFEKIIKKAYKCNYRNVLCNTTVNGDLTPILKKNSFNIVSLVHELPATIKKLGLEKNASLLAEHSDFVIFPSKYVMNNFLSICSIKSKCLIKPQGVNLTDKFTINRNEAKEKIYQFYSIPKSSKIVLGVGVGDKRKGYDLFLDIVGNCTNEKVKFVWVGNYRKEIYEKKLRDYCVSKFDNLHQVGFISDVELLSIIYAAADVFALTSREDPFPSVVLQAFNAKTPVVGFKDAGGFEDIVKDEHTGFLVDYESSDEMLRAITLLVNEKSKREEMGNKAKEIINNYGFREYVDYLLAAFQKCDERG